MLNETITEMITGEAVSVKARAQRFGLQVPLRYRPLGENIWEHGETENISRSGVLFHSGSFATVGIHIEFCLILPEVNSYPAAELACQGIIVRAISPVEEKDFSTLAVRILHFRLVRP
ncbi:MAG: hypothetical protein ACRD2B_00500 [Terriglobia bacterium]